MRWATLWVAALAAAACGAERWACWRLCPGRAPALAGDPPRIALATPFKGRWAVVVCDLDGGEAVQVCGRGGAFPDLAPTEEELRGGISLCAAPQLLALGGWLVDLRGPALVDLSERLGAGQRVQTCAVAREGGWVCVVAKGEGQRWQLCLGRMPELEFETVFSSARPLRAPCVASTGDVVACLVCQSEAGEGEALACVRAGQGWRKVPLAEKASAARVAPSGERVFWLSEGVVHGAEIGAGGVSERWACPARGVRGFDVDAHGRWLALATGGGAFWACYASPVLLRVPLEQAGEGERRRARELALREAAIAPDGRTMAFAGEVVYVASRAVAQRPVVRPLALGRAGPRPFSEVLAGLWELAARLSGAAEERQPRAGGVCAAAEDGTRRYFCPSLSLFLCLPPGWTAREEERALCLSDGRGREVARLWAEEDTGRALDELARQALAELGAEPAGQWPALLLGVSAVEVEGALGTGEQRRVARVACCRAGGRVYFARAVFPAGDGELGEVVQRVWESLALAVR